MDPTSPFAPQSTLPIIGEPKVVAATTIITFLCTCETKAIVQAIAGIPATCGMCKRYWGVTAQLQIGIQQFIKASPDATES